MVRSSLTLSFDSPLEFDAVLALARRGLEEVERVDGGPNPRFRRLLNELSEAKTAAVASTQTPDLREDRVGPEVSGSRGSVPPWSSCQCVAGRLGVLPRQVARLCSSGTLAGVQPAGPGTPWLVDPKSVEALLELRCAVSDPEAA